jgi:hypothetical protein
VYIPEPTLNPTTVGLLRIKANGGSSVIPMNDTGKNGDQKPGDKTFTAQFTLNEMYPGTFSFEVSADFRGKNLVLSAPQQFAVLAPHINPVILPPDPGADGKLTLAGIDSDGDGVRDDVQRYIILTYPQSEKLRMGLNQEARAIQKLVLDSANKNQALSDSNTELDAGICLLGLSNGVKAGRPLDDQLHSVALNTIARIKAYLTADSLTSGSAYTLPNLGDRLTRCSFDPLGLPN